MFYAMNKSDFEDRLMICRDQREMERLRPIFSDFDMMVVDEPFPNHRYGLVLFTHHPEIDLGDLMYDVWEAGLAGESRVIIMG